MGIDPRRDTKPVSYTHLSIKLSKGRNFVSTNGQCLSFDKQTGKYLGSIGHKGEDPKGYSNASCFIHPVSYTHLQSPYYITEEEEIRSLIKPRKRFAHKGASGTVV